MLEKIKRISLTERSFVLKNDISLSYQYCSNNNPILKAMSSHIIILRALGVEYNSFLIAR